MITKDKVNKIIKLVPLKEVINKYIHLEKVGQSYRGFSPFNNENHPSFMISEKKKIWKDFSSGRFGNVITFLMYIKKYNFIKTIYYLNDKYHLNLFKKQYKYYNNYKKYYQILNKIKIIKEKINNINFILNYHFIKKLNKNKSKLNYLIKTRKIPINLVKKFNLGYCDYNDKSFDILKNQYKKKLLFNSGVFIKKKKNI
ncbi:MAG: CHC2 zinc finger domain-containing protein [Candidatus Shikimatogenerans sp. Tmey]